MDALRLSIATRREKRDFGKRKDSQQNEGEEEHKLSKEFIQTRTKLLEKAQKYHALKSRDDSLLPAHTQVDFEAKLNKKLRMVDEEDEDTISRSQAAIPPPPLFKNEIEASQRKLNERRNQVDSILKSASNEVSLRDKDARWESVYTYNPE